MEFKSWEIEVALLYSGGCDLKVRYDWHEVMLLQMLPNVELYWLSQSSCLLFTYSCCPSTVVVSGFISNNNNTVIVVVATLEIFMVAVLSGEGG